jgi:hypothetical protein
MPASDDQPLKSRTRPDWRGWIALAWVVIWASAYTVTVIQARCPRLLSWFLHR